MSPTGKHQRINHSKSAIRWIVIASGLIAVVAISLVYARSHPPRPVRAFYLDIGGSSSLGNEPTGQPGNNGRPTSDRDTPRGYANDVVSLLADKVHFRLRQVGCPGETTISMLSLGDACYTLPNTQLTVATDFLDHHSHERGLISVDLGFNDVRPCLAHPSLEQTCVNHGLANVSHNLPLILTVLRHHIDSKVTMVGFLYDDPFLSHYLQGPSGRRDASQTLRAITHLNTILSSIYSRFHIRTTNQPSSFSMASTRMVSLRDGRRVPLNVAKVCDYTWMCRTPPWGPDDHPDNEGYLVIARSIVANAPSSLWRN